VSYHVFVCCSSVELLKLFAFMTCCLLSDGLLLFAVMFQMVLLLMITCHDYHFNVIIRTVKNVNS